MWNRVRLWHDKQLDKLYREKNVWFCSNTIKVKGRKKKISTACTQNAKQIQNICLDYCWPHLVLCGLGVGMAGGESSPCWYFATCLQAAWIRSNKHITLMTSVWKRVGGTKPPHVPVPGHYKDTGVKVRGQRHPWTFQYVLQTGMCCYNCKAKSACLLWHCSCKWEQQGHGPVFTAHALKATFLLHIIPIFLAERLVQSCWCRAMPVSPGSFPKGEASLMHW